MKVTVRCYHCDHIHKIYDYSTDYVFIPQTLQLWAHLMCRECGHIGHEVYIQAETPEQTESEAHNATS